jgi:hypothetical protein
MRNEGSCRGASAFLSGEKEDTMASHEFMIKLNRSITAEEVDALYEAGCADAAVETGPAGTLLDFSRDAATLADALLSAVRDIEKVPGLSAIGVSCESLVSLADVAERSGVTREAARLWSTGQRGPGGFPEPVAISARTGEKGWDWHQVAEWLEGYRHVQILDISYVNTARVLHMADRVLAARHALKSEPDEAVREEFERLLEDA